MRRPLTLAFCMLAAAVPSAAADVVPGAVLDGPFASTGASVDLDVAPDGTAVAAYLKHDGGVDHVYATRYDGAAWSAPQRVDTGLAQASRNVTVAASNGGRAVVGFLNGPGDYTARAAVAGPGGAPFTLTTIQGDPAHRILDVDAAPDGTAYAVMSTGPGYDVRAHRLDGTTWPSIGDEFPLPGGVLDAVAADEAAGDSQRRARVAVAGDGTAVIAWSETDGSGYEVWARRLTGTAAGPAQRVDVPQLPDGTPAADTADMVDVAAGPGNRAWITFRQLFSYGGDVPRALVRPMDGDVLGAATVADGLGDGNPGKGAEFPRIALDGSGGGLVATARQDLNEVRAGTLDGIAERLDTTTPPSAPGPVTAVGGEGTGVVAWRFDEGGGGATLKARRRPAGGAHGPELTLSDTTLGAVEFGAYAAAADAAGAVHAAYLQGPAGLRRFAIARLDGPPPVAPSPGGGPPPAAPQPPGGPGAAPRFGNAVNVSLLSPGRRARVRRGRVAVRLRNRNAFAVKALIRIRAGKRTRSARLTLAAGRSRTVRVRTPRSHGRVVLTVRLTDPAGTHRTLTRRVRLVR